MTSQPPKPPKWPQNNIFELPRGNTCCLTQKTTLRMYFEETTYELHTDITASKWRHNSPSHRNNPKMIFWSCWEGILAVWPQKQPSRCILKKTPTCSLHCDVTTPYATKVTPKRFFRVAEMKCLLFDPKTNLLHGFSRISEHHVHAPPKWLVESKRYTGESVTRPFHFIHPLGDLITQVSPRRGGGAH